MMNTQTIIRAVIFTAAIALLAGCVPLPESASSGAKKTFIKQELNLSAEQQQVIDLRLGGSGWVWIDFSAAPAYGSRGSGKFSVMLAGQENRGTKGGYYARFDGKSGGKLQYFVSEHDLSLGNHWKVIVQSWDRRGAIQGLITVTYPGFRYAEQAPRHYPQQESGGYVEPAYSPPPPAARQHRVEPAKRRVHTVAPAKGQTHTAVPVHKKPSWINRKFTLSPSFGNRQAVQFRLNRPGRVIMDATWQDANTPLAIMLNGPGQTHTYTRKDGKSRSRVEFVVTPVMFARGNTWTATIANFSKQGPVRGILKIGYPGK